MKKDETYYENLDKRTKEYKAWKEKRDAASEGLGDSIEKITEATGIKAAVKFLAGEDCGCDARKEKINKLFGYNNPECLTEDEYLWLADFFSGPRSAINNIEQRRMLKIYNRVFRANKQVTSCSPCIKSVYDKLQQYFQSYQ
jgi:hypothetical protein